MYLQNLYNELQLNPRNKVTYRKLSEVYRKSGMINEAEAFEELIRKKFDDNHPITDKEQSTDD